MGEIDASVDSLVDVLSAWNIPPPLSVRPPNQGTNNLVWLLDDTYVLRIHQNVDATRAEAEGRLLEVLSSEGRLPFAVPEPIVAADGRSVVQTDTGPAVLFPCLPGRSPAQSDLGDLHRVGKALAYLDLALGDMPHGLAPIDHRVSLESIHPAVPSVADLCVQLARLLPGNAGVECLRDQATSTNEEYLHLIHELPVQIVHGDLAFSNVLIGPGREVSAVLDFEIAGVDVRVNDLVAALAMAVDWGDPAQESQVAAFRTGYSQVISLNPAEEAAIPMLLRRRALVSVIWRAGRWRQGLATLDEVRDRLVGLDSI